MTVTADTPTPEALWQQLAPRAGLTPEAFARDATWVPPGTRAGTFVVRFAGPDSLYYVLKRYSSLMEPERFERIMATVAAAASRLDAGPSRIPKVLAHDVATRAAIMEWVPGTELYLQMEEAEDHGPLLTQAGAWLADFHRAGDFKAGRFWPKPHIERQREQRTQVTDGEVAVCESENFLAGLDATLAALPSCRGHETPISWQHGDPNLHNFMVSVDTVWGLDLTRVARGPIANDVAHFLAFYGAVMSDQGRQKPGKPAPRPALAAFFKGYNVLKEEDPVVRVLEPRAARENDEAAAFQV